MKLPFVMPMDILRRRQGYLDSLDKEFWESTFKWCPQCYGHYTVLPDFGLRQGRSQSWCKDCRNSSEVKREALRRKYIAAYPNDKANAKRSQNFMRMRLKHKRVR